jgi:hypothetical protein
MQRIREAAELWLEVRGAKRGVARGLVFVGVQPRTTRLAPNEASHGATLQGLAATLPADFSRHQRIFSIHDVLSSVLASFQ